MDTLYYTVGDSSIRDYKHLAQVCDLDLNLVDSNACCFVACYNDSGNADSMAVDIAADWATSDTEYLYIYTPSQERHDGKWNSNRYRLESSTTPIIYIHEENVRIEGLQVFQTNTSDNSSYGIRVNVTSAGNIYISDNIVKGDISAIGTYNNGIYFYNNAGAGSEARVWNNMVYNFPNATGHGITLRNTNWTGYFYNNTVYNCGYANIRNFSGTCVAKNNIGILNSNGDFVGTFHDSSDYNCSGDATAPGTHSLHNKTAYDIFSDTTKSLPNLCLKANSVCIDSATDLSSDPDLPFNDDILGNARSGAWDIGGHEFVKAGKSVKRVYKTSIKDASVR